MANRISTIKKGNDEIYPVTKTKAVFNDDGVNLEDLIFKKITDTAIILRDMDLGAYILTADRTTIWLTTGTFGNTIHAEKNSILILTRYIVNSETKYHYALIGCEHSGSPDPGPAFCSGFYTLDNSSSGFRWMANTSFPANTPGATTYADGYGYAPIGSLGGDRVVETYISTDGLSWYRKWASGWKECGYTRKNLPGTSGGFDVALPITFSTPDYMAVACISSTDTEWTNVNGGEMWFYTVGVYVKTTNSCRVHGVHPYNRDAAPPFSLYCCGY